MKFRIHGASWILVILYLNGVFFASNLFAVPIQQQSGPSRLSNAPKPSAKKFEITETDEGLQVTIGGKLFAGYVITESNKPYLFPIIGPTGKQMTRVYPMDLVDHEAKWQRDHPRHRGLPSVMKAQAWQAGSFLALRTTGKTSSRRIE